MPCFSVVKNTVMDKPERIEEALRQLGHEVRESTPLRIVGSNGLVFTRQKVGEAFSVRDPMGLELEQVGKKYAELGVRAWAQRNGMRVTQADEQGAKLVSVRR